MSPRLVDPSRLACSTLCFRQFPLAEALAAIADLGFTHVDIGTMPGYCPHFDFTASPDSSAERDFITALDRSGLQVHTFTTHLGHVNDPTIDPAAALAAGLRSLHVAAKIGAFGINVNCGTYRDRTLYPLSHDIGLVADLLRGLAPTADTLGLRLMVEAPHKGNLLRTPDEALQLLAACDDPALQLILDVNHHHAAGWSPARSVTVLGAPRIGLVHLRDAVGRENRYPLGTGEIDFRELFTALAAAGYSGRTSFEFTDAAPTVEGNAALLRDSLTYLLQL